MQLMTLEGGRQVFVKKADLDKMYQDRKVGMDIDGTFYPGTIGSPRGNSSSANTLKDARIIAADIEEKYGRAPKPDSDDPQEQADYEDYRLARQHIRAGLGGESGGFLESQGRPQSAPPKPQPKQGTVETKSFVTKRLSKKEGQELERQGYRLQRDPVTGDIRVYKP
jgi:hypothetical protein